MKAAFLSRKYTPSTSTSLSKTEEVLVCRIREKAVEVVLANSPPDRPYIACAALDTFADNKTVRAAVGKAHVSTKLRDAKEQIFENARNFTTRTGRASGGTNHQLRVALSQVLGENVPAVYQKVILEIGKKAAMTGLRMRSAQVLSATKQLRLPKKGAYKNKLDLSIAARHWCENTKEVPGRECHRTLRTERDKPHRTGHGIDVLARIDASGELKLLRTDAWDCGRVGQLGKRLFWYVQHTTHWVYDKIDVMYADFIDSSDHAEYTSKGEHPISKEMYRQARPFYCVPAGPDECACPLHTEVEANRTALRRRIRKVHEEAKKKGTCSCDCLKSAFFNMTKDSAAEKEALLCAPSEVTALEVGGTAPLLYRRACSEGEKCEDCKWNPETQLRQKMPEMPSCFAAALKQEMVWQQRMPEGEVLVAEIDEGEMEQEEQRAGAGDEGGATGNSEVGENLSSLTVAVLKERLNALRLSTSGLKAVLLARLEQRAAADEEPEEEEAVQEQEDQQLQDDGGLKEQGEVETKKTKRKVMKDVRGTQQQFFDQYVVKMEAGLAHSWRCRWTNQVMKRRYANRARDELIIETDFSASFEFRPSKAECCAWYKNCSILPLIVHYTNESGARQKDVIIVCSDDLSSNFKVHKHCMQKVLAKYLPNLPLVKRVTVVTDNCRKQYRNRNLYGWLTTFCKENHGVSMGHLYQEQYHGKGLCDAICGLFKIQARREIFGKDSNLKAKVTLDTHKKLAEFGKRTFCKTATDDNNHSINKYEFWTLEAGEAGEYPGDNMHTISVDKLHYPLTIASLLYTDYAPVVKYDLSQHEVWSNNELEGGDLRTREAICACDSCLRGDNYGCLVSEETGAILKFFCKPSAEGGQAAAAGEFEEAAVAFCAAAKPNTPLLMPTRLAGAQGLQHANQYEIGFPSTSAPLASDRERESDWPSYMYYAYDQDAGKYRAAVHADWYFRRNSMNTLDFVQHTHNKTVFCGQILPVDIDEGELLSKPAATNKLQVPATTDTAVKKLNFMRFGVVTQVY